MTISRRVAWDGSQLAANGGKSDAPDEALHNSAVVGSSNAPVEVDAGPPPKGGAGSGLDEWRAYADSVGVLVHEDMTRDEIIDAVESAEEH